jgi:hypothetical protein
MPRDLAALSLLALIGLSCVGVGNPTSGDADSIGETAMASESGVLTETGTDTESGSTSETTTETSSESEAGSETGSSGSETATETGTGTETETTTDTETETGNEGPTPDLGVLAIVDVNPNSATYDQKVHPLDYEGQLSGWYFGHAT